MSAWLSKENARIFRITHIDNVVFLLGNGFFSQSLADTSQQFISIGSQELIDKRQTKTVPIEPYGILSNYIPFYFTPYSPMLLNILTGYNKVTKHDPNDIVIFASSLKDIFASDVKFVFTNAHAYLAETEFFSDLEDLQKIDWLILQNKDFKSDENDLGKRQRYQAEALIYQHLPVELIKGLICYSEVAKQRILSSCPSIPETLTILVRPDLYFQV